jgi:hypothetical protein
VIALPLLLPFVVHAAKKTLQNSWQVENQKQCAGTSWDWTERAAKKAAETP